MTTTSKQTTNELVANIKAARRVSTPIVLVTTGDAAATIATLTKEVNGGSLHFRWDVARGLRPRNEAAVEWLNNNAGSAADDLEGNPVEVLQFAERLPAGSFLYIVNAHRFWDEPIVMQSIWNLRDEFKMNRRMLVLLAPDSHNMPMELRNSIITFDEPLPDDEQLSEIVNEQVSAAADAFKKAGVTVTPEQVRLAATSLRGTTAACQAEQLAAMSLDPKEGINIAMLRSQARKQIDETPGLAVDKGGETFADIGGLQAAKEFGRRLFSGPDKPAVVVRVEELEKVMGGSRTDMSGTSQDALQVILSAMEDNNWTGMVAYGAPGAGKSLYSKSLANEHDALPMSLDLNATKGRLVGQSEQQVRAAMKVIHAIGGKDVFFIASVNGLAELPPELLRRFRCGIWFFDILSEEERPQVWEICKNQFGIQQDAPQPDDTDMTGADIRNICEMAHKLNCSLTEALNYVVPLRTMDPGSIQTARERADGKYLSANTKGVYRMPKSRTADTKKAKAKANTSRTVSFD